MGETSAPPVQLNLFKDKDTPSYPVKADAVFFDVYGWDMQASIEEDSFYLKNGTPMKLASINFLHRIIIGDVDGRDENMNIVLRA